MAQSFVSGLTLEDVARVYDAIADEYDEIYHSPIDLAENEVVSELIPRGLRFADLGCGNGLGLELVLNNVSQFGAQEGQMEIAPLQYFGIDISAAMVAHAEDRWGTEHYRFVVGDMLTFMGGSFDVVLSLFGSPNYVDFEKLAQVAYRCLGPGGQAFLMPFTHFRLRRNKPIPAAEGTVAVNPFEARTAMERAGFEFVDIQGLGDIHTDEIASGLTQKTLKRVMRERLEFTRNSYYLIVTGVKP